jgi:membrane-bound metal-dependent hydrolase YbcI (DUF457 family)
MFIGHPAVGFASKRVTPEVSLGLLVAAPMLLDLLWPIFLLLGIEHVRIRPGITVLSPLDFTDYPWSHSLAMSIVWGILLGGGYWIVRRNGRGALILFLGVVSHWILDLFVHRPDLPLWPGGPKYGLGLWNHPIAEIGIESALFAIGILIYRDTTQPLDRIGSVAMWALVLILAAMFIFGASGRPPQNERQLAWAALVIEWIIPLWAWWFDRHRAVVVRSS